MARYLNPRQQKYAHMNPALLPHGQNCIEKLSCFFYSSLGEADLIKQHLRKNSFRAALKFNTNLSFAEKILLLTAKTQMEV
jgi:hypothetical protein